MQVWEARECCLMVLTVSNAIQMIVENIATMGGGMLQELYTMYNYAQTIYSIVQDPIGAALNFIGNGILSGIKTVADKSGLTSALGSVANGIKESVGSMAG
jgi:phage-related protein